jgi:hypothetical protein
MTGKDILDLFSAISVLYPKSEAFTFGNDREKARIATEMWLALLGDLEKSLVIAALQKHALTSKWPPTVAELRQIATSIQHPDTTLGADEAYGMLNRALHMHGFYEQEKHSSDN